MTGLFRGRWPHLLTRFAHEPRHGGIAELAGDHMKNHVGGGGELVMRRPVEDAMLIEGKWFLAEELKPYVTKKAPLETQPIDVEGDALEGSPSNKLEGVIGHRRG